MEQELKNRIAKQIWYLCVKLENPWFQAAASGLDGYREKWEAWNVEQLDLTRELCLVVYGDLKATDDLLKRGLDFIERLY